MHFVNKGYYKYGHNLLPSFVGGEKRAIYRTVTGAGAPHDLSTPTTS